MHTEDITPLSGSDMQITQEEVVIPEPELTLKVERSGMTAYLFVKVFAEDQVIESKQVFELLEQHNITYGICHEAIDEYCKNKQYEDDLICAKGCLPVDGIDGKIEYLFKKNLVAKPQECEDGSVDYFDLGLIQNVKKGDILCSLIPPEEGVPGIDVYGKTIAYKQGLRPDFHQGRNTEVTEDGLHLISSIDGYIDYRNLIVNVIDLYTVKGDVDHSVGNIDFVGTVIINGDVREGFRIKAGKDVIVRGMVEGSIIEAKNDITISQGMRGMGKGKLISGGDICGKFFENSGVSAKKNVTGETFINCNVKAGESIILNGRRGSIIGGEYIAGHTVNAKQIGSEAYAATNITIKLPHQAVSQLAPENKEVMEELRKEHTEKLTVVEQALMQMRNRNCDPQTKNKYIKALIGEKMKIQTALKELEVSETSQEGDLTYCDYKVIAERVAYPGVKIAIGPCRLYIGQEYCNQKFYIEDGEIRSFPVSPADRGNL